jgi:hypothetical protein
MNLGKEWDSVPFVYTYGMPTKSFRAQLKLSMAIEKLRRDLLSINPFTGDVNWRTYINPDKVQEYRKLQKKRWQIVKKFWNGMKAKRVPKHLQ